MCFSEGGERFAAIGQGGLAAAWRLDAPQFTRSDSGPLARSDWCHQVSHPTACAPARVSTHTRFHGWPIASSDRCRHPIHPTV